MVIDASAATALCLSAAGFDLLESDLQAPFLVRSETLAALQGLQWRGEITDDLAEIGVSRLLDAPIHLVRRKVVWQEARRIALEVGWAKTYDAEYVALARLSGEPLLTLDERLARRVRGFVAIRTPNDL